jgi:hypothetical protein
MGYLSCRSAEACIYGLWCIQREMCKKETMKDEMPRPPPMPAVVDVAPKDEVYAALSRLFLACAPHCTPADNALHLVNQIDNVIAGYQQSLDEVAKAARTYAEQVGDGPLLRDVRDGFIRLARMAPPWHDT